ncbi:HigA family addiction module antitoxin [Mesorhizobium dulcispinae]|uniref:HigA family addiction module antitoxin n=1 Tax=Mesorhizobium dulcispinae TaxID=3072316 RepID=UPI002A24E311|nr:HigA family addiction module antitoxin [Mesorhizobium sp. VK23D]MDX8521115.1 HigA family addiction module antitoxin [Mesorhizobium sp. VK23D]
MDGVKTVADREWSPDWATHPGDHLAEYIESRGWNQAEFARLADMTPKLVSTIINGSNPVTAETALKLERVLGMKASIWTSLQSNWDLHQARLAKEKQLDEASDFVSCFPVKELVDRGVLRPTRDISRLLEDLLKFIGIGSPHAMQARFDSLAVHHRQSRAFNTDHFHVAAWLILGEHKARSMNLDAYDSHRFITAVHEIRDLTVTQPDVFEPRMYELCRAAGVAFVLEKPITKTRLFGSARWIEGDRAIIQMSLRMKSNDHFWWTFFHEAAHIVLHKGRSFADDKGGEGDGVEDEADSWAEDVLVGTQRFAEFKATKPRSEKDVVEFSHSVGIHPGIVVGMLQHNGIIKFTHLNGLKERFEWKDD